MSSTIPPTTDELRISPVYCAECNHTAPIECKGCGGRAGSDGWRPCSYCRPKPVSEPTPAMRDPVDGSLVVGDGEASGVMSSDE
jgi:hypothetical protein